MVATTFQRHLDAINAGTVSKVNVIGIRKAINHVERLRAGLSGNRSRVRPDEADRLENALDLICPRVTGELHETGVNLLRNPRYAKRWTDRQRGIIDSLKKFRLIRFDRIGHNGLNAVPVYLAIGANGASFAFRNIPWQTAYALGAESGPFVVESF